MTSSPIQSSNFLTGLPNNSDNRAATGVKRRDSSTPLGRPKWLVKITLAPLEVKSWIVGRAARIRVSSVIEPLSRGTLKSTRTNTRFPDKSDADKSATVFFDTG